MGKNILFFYLFYLHATGCQTVCASGSRQTQANSYRLFHVACDWRPCGYNLYVTGGHLVTICMRLATSRMLFLHATGGQCSAKPPFFQSTLQEHLLEFKIRNHKQSENLRIQYILARAYPSINTMHGPIQSRETVPLNNSFCNYFLLNNIFYSK
jgi:hypothetical protein